MPRRKVREDHKGRFIQTAGQRWRPRTRRHAVGDEVNVATAPTTSLRVGDRPHHEWWDPDHHESP